MRHQGSTQNESFLKLFFPVSISDKRQGQEDIWTGLSKGFRKKEIYCSCIAMGAASRLSLPSLASLYRSMTTLSTLSLVAPEAVAAAGSAKTKLKPKALASLASRKAPLRHRQRQTRRARKLSSSSSSSDSDTSSADVQGKRVPSSSKVSLDAEPHSPVSLPDSDVTALLESNDFDLSLGPSASVPITTRRRTSRNTTSGDESIPQLTSGDKKRRWRPDDDITAQSFLPLTKRPRAGLKGSNAEVPIAIISRTPKKSSDFIRYCIRPTLFEQFSAKDLEWCRYVRQSSLENQIANVLTVNIIVWSHREDSNCQL